MKRSWFMVVAAVVPGVFGLVMMAAPDLMLDNSLAVDADATARAITQWVGFGVFSLASINFFARNDAGSPALRAVMIGNVIFHVLGIGIDVMHFAAGHMSSSGLTSGLVPHTLLAVGFVYYLTKLGVVEAQPRLATAGRASVR